MLNVLAALAALGATSVSAAPTDGPPLQIWMNNDRRFRPGDRVRLQIDADVDGYLLVLNYDTDGRLRVLFPLDPRDDATVRAGRRYEVRGDDGSGAFRAGGDGTGLIYSAIAREPWRLDDLVLDGRWDYARLSIDPSSDNPEAAITELVQQLSGPGGFDYDLAGYRVYGTTTTYSYGDYGVRGPIYVYDDYLYCNDWYWRYSGCRRWPYDGGWSFGFGYYGSRYGYGYYPYYPYSYPYRPSFPVGGRRPVIVGRPRSYTVFPRPPAVGTGRIGGNIGTGRGPVREVSTPAINWRPRSVARPVTGRGPEVNRGSGEGRVFEPPARRSGGSEDRPSYPAPRARGGEERGRDNGPRANGADRGNWDPPARTERRPNNDPPARTERRPGNDPPPRAEPRSRGEPHGSPPPRAQPSGGNGRPPSGGGHSAPSRPRHP